MTVVAHCIPRYAHLLPDAAESSEALAYGWGSVTEDDWYLKRTEIEGQPVQHTRNLLVKWAIEQNDGDPDSARVYAGGGPPADLILWQDTDVSFSPGEVVRMLETLHRAPADVAMIGAPLIVQSREGDVRANVNVNGFEDALPALMAGECVSVAQVGFGLVACRADAYRAHGFPWHEFKYAEGDIGKAIGEDGGWCDEMRALGWSIFCDGRVHAWHTFPRRWSIRSPEHWLVLTGAKPKKE